MSFYKRLILSAEGKGYYRLQIKCSYAIPEKRKSFGKVKAVLWGWSRCHTL